MIREDPVRAGLLFAGTEHGVFVSTTNGAQWEPLALNLPDVQVSDLVIKDQDVVIATHGRSFWVLDNIATLRHATSAMLAGTERSVHLMPPATIIRRTQNATLDYYLPPDFDSVTVTILTSAGAVVRTLTGAAKPGVQRVTWDLTWPGATSFAGIVLEGGNPTRGVLVSPGAYRVQLDAHGVSGLVRRAAMLTVRRDPRLSSVTDADLQAQTALALRIRDAESAANEAVLDVRRRRNAWREQHGAAAADTSTFIRSISRIEAELYQVRNQSPKDKIAFPIKINDRLTGLRAIVESGDGRPTEAQYRVLRELRRELDALLGTLKTLLAADGRSLYPTGSVTTNSVRPGRDPRSSTRPACISAMRCAMARPSPAPLVADVSARDRAESTRKNRSNTRVCISAGIPTPSSTTLIAQPSAAFAIETTTCPPDDEYLIALSRRFSKRRPSKSASPRLGAATISRRSISTPR